MACGSPRLGSTTAADSTCGAGGSTPPFTVSTRPVTRPGQRGPHFGRTLVLSVCLAIALLVPAVPPAAAQPTPDAGRGVFVYTWDIAVTFPPTAPNPSTQGLVQSLAVPGVDGITLVEGWKDVEPARGVFEWDPSSPSPDLLDAWLGTALASGKQINVAIRAGKDTPCWLFDQASQPCGAGYSGDYAGVLRLPFEVSPHQGLTPKAKCDQVAIAPPWDPAFLAEWDAMLGALSQHLKDVGAYDAVAQVRLTGVNRTTDEFRLPEEILAEPSCTTNALTTWLGYQPTRWDGYRPSRLRQGWDAITTSFATRFPDKAVNLPIIPVDTGNASYPFPEIDEQGCVYSPIPITTKQLAVPVPVPGNACKDTLGSLKDFPDQNLDLVRLANDRFPGRLTVEFESLIAGRPGNPAVVQYAQTLGTGMAYMTNDFLAASGGAGTACSGGFTKGEPCKDSGSYLALVESGIHPVPADHSLTSRFVEVFPPDVNSFPDAIWQAHLDLVGCRGARVEGGAADGVTAIVPCSQQP